MEQRITNEQLEKNKRYITNFWCSCDPPNLYWAVIWGGILILSGAGWLLFNFNLLPALFLDVLGPLVIIVIGIAYLGRGYWNRIK